MSAETPQNDALAPADETEEPDEREIFSLTVSDGECVILDRDVFLGELDYPTLIRMTGSQVWLYWYADGEWTYSEIKAKLRGAKKVTLAAVKN